MMLVIGFTVTTTLTAAFRLWTLRRQRNPSRVERAFQTGMLLVAASVAFLMLVESML
jgi:hypothetical protein